MSFIFEEGFFSKQEINPHFIESFLVLCHSLESVNYGMNCDSFFFLTMGNNRSSLKPTEKTKDSGEKN